MVMVIDAQGKIKRIDEYYNKRWDDGIRERDYTVVIGPSVQQKL